MKKIIIMIIVFVITTINTIFSKELITSCGVFPLNEYNVAIVGNSHASYMSDFVKIDNDLHSIMVGNHSIGGDDLMSYGLSHMALTDNKNGQTLIALKGDCQGWINKFIEESKDKELAICWFGSNSLTKDINKFENDYREWLRKVREQGEKCKIILMAIPYMNVSVKTYSNSEENIDNFNKKIEKVAKEFKNVYYEKTSIKYSFVDRVHLTEDTYKKIFNEIIKKYNITPKKTKEVDINKIAWFNGFRPYHWCMINGNWLYKENIYFAKNKWILYKDDWYYVDENGIMLKDTITPDGKWVDENGKMINYK